MSNLTLEQCEQGERAAARDDARRGLKFHGIATVLVCTLLVAIDLTVAPEVRWAIFPAVGMTIGVLAHWYFGVRHADETMRQHHQDIPARTAA